MVFIINALYNYSIITKFKFKKICRHGLNLINKVKNLWNFLAKFVDLVYQNHIIRY